MPASPRRRSRTDFTERQLAFIREYLVDLKPADAARRAGYSAESANRIAYVLRRQPKIAARIEQVQARRAEKKRVTADRVLEELGKMAFSNIRDYVDWGPQGVTIRDNALLDDEQTAAVADVEPKGNGKLARLKLYDKLAALNALARHLGMIGGKTALAPPGHDDEERKAANAELRARLMRIVRSGEKK
jgi:phage terminase small subunit